MSVETLSHYGIIGMKWGVRRTPEQLGHAPKSEQKAFRKQVKADEKEYRQLRREVTAAQKNVKDRSKQDDISKSLVTDAEKNYEEAISRREPLFSSRKKADRRLAISVAEQELDKRLEASERSEGKKRQALKNAQKAIDRMDSFLEEMNDKYGAENVKQMNRKDVTTGALWWKQVRMEDGFKTPMNTASAPLIGRAVSARIINQMEREDRNELMNERLSDYERKKYA